MTDQVTIRLRALKILIFLTILPLFLSALLVSFVYCARKVEREMGATDGLPHNFDRYSPRRIPNR